MILSDVLLLSTGMPKALGEFITLLQFEVLHLQHSKFLRTVSDVELSFELFHIPHMVLVKWLEREILLSLQSEKMELWPDHIKMHFNKQELPHQPSPHVPFFQFLSS